MLNQDLQSAVEHCQRAISEHSHLIAKHETNTRYTLIDPILWALGWETWNPRQCELEYRPEGLVRVDYALFNRQGEQVVAVEAKRLGHLRQQNNLQLAKYVRDMPEGMAVLTDGNHWSIYNLAKPGGNLETRLDTQVIIANSTSCAIARKLSKALNRNLWW